MGIIQIVTPENAQGEIKEIYSAFMKKAGIVPKPLQLMSASPQMLKNQTTIINYYMSHKNLSFALLSHIRYLVAKKHNYQFCINFNKNLLKMQGLDDGEISKIDDDPEKSLLEDKEKAMLKFVLKAVENPDSTEQKDVDDLHQLGWTDNDIFDAVAHGVNMIGSGIMMKAFKMDNC